MDSYSLGKLYIKKRLASEWLIAFVFFFTFIQAFIVEILGIPDILKFLVDGCLALLVIKLLVSRNTKISKPLLPFIVVISIFFAYTLIAYLLNYQSIFYYVWGLRNNFRFYIAFIAFAFLLQWDDAKRWLGILDWIYFLNFIVVLIQFFVGYGQDYLGGIFGVQRGCNGTLLIFLSIVVCRSLLSFMKGETGKGKCIVISITSLMISAFAELKFFFIIFIIMLFLTALMTSHSIRKTLFFAFCAFLIVVFSTVLSVLYEEFSQFLSLENLWNALLNPNYATDEDIGRLTALPIISERFLPGLTDQLFGMGLGNCDSSSLAIFNTPFYDSYHALHYSYFSYSFLFLETGFVGLLLYMSFFVISFAVAFRFYKNNIGDQTACQMSMIMSILCLALVFYNNSLRNEAGVLAFFVLALPFISARKTKAV